VPPQGLELRQAADREAAIAEALDQLKDIEADEDDRRKTTDAKLSSAQNAIGFIVALAGGSVALAFLQMPSYDLWHGLVIVALTIAVLFFVWSACQIVAANDPRSYQGRTAAGVRRMLDQGKSKEELQLDAIGDLVSNVNANVETTNKRLTLYRAAIENIRKGVIFAGLVPAIALIGYILNAFVATQLPSYMRITVVATASPTASPAPLKSQSPSPSVKQKIPSKATKP
jgi:hypothetical protein